MTQQLQPLRFQPLPLGSIKPRGWLLNQLRIQARSLSGHLDEFWEGLVDSAWFGGNSDGWERAPYWLDGVVPLAFLLDDPALRKKVIDRVETVISRQKEDGWIAPTDTPHEYDMWALFIILKVLMQYHEVTQKNRVLECLQKCFRCLDKHTESFLLNGWARFRWFEALIPLFYVYDHTGEAWLLKLADKLRAQGFGWESLFDNYPHHRVTPRHQCNLMTHVVNNAMAVKSGGLCRRLTGEDRYCASVYSMIGQLDEHHGTVAGIFTGDEHVAGKSPIHGTELCAVVEYMYSLESLLSTVGDPAFADRLEKIAFNALPATLSPDMWTHQYDQQANQVQCNVSDNPPWTNNNSDANCFGLEPNYGCCTADFNQGWPKFATHLWMHTDDGGLAAVAHAPNEVNTRLNDTEVTVLLDTEYPFRDELTFTVTCETPSRFPLYLRIPSWATDATVAIDDETERPKPGSFHKLEREWKGRTTVVLKVPMQPRVEVRFNNARSIIRGPLVYSLKIGEEWKQLDCDTPGHEPPHCDYEVYATTPWNYALALTPETVCNDIAFEEHAVGDCPFSPDGAPVTARIKGKRLTDWKLDEPRGCAGVTPHSPATTNQPEEELVLIPYGCTNLRVTEFPVL